MYLPRRHLLIGTLAVSALAMGGCASLNTVTSEVTSFGQWPEGRAKGRYLIERLPSQLARSDRDGTQAAVEEAAHQALQRAGFTRVGDLASADVVVQIGARITRFEISPWHDPLWWRWGPSYWRGPGWVGWRTPPGVYWRQAPMPERCPAARSQHQPTPVGSPRHFLGQRHRRGGVLRHVQRRAERFSQGQPPAAQPHFSAGRNPGRSLIQYGGLPLRWDRPGPSGSGRGLGSHSCGSAAGEAGRAGPVAALFPRPAAGRVFWALRC